MAGEDIPLSPLTGRPTRPLPRGPLGAPQQPQQPQQPSPQSPPQFPFQPQPLAPSPQRPPSGRLPQPGASLFLDSDQQGRAPIPPTEPVPPPGVTRSVADDESAGGAPSGPILGIIAGRYELEAKLGEGGMGTVYRCFDRHLKRRAALKQILPEKLRPDRVTRFLHEAHSMARLQHPGCVAVYDVGVAPGGAPYMVMELVEGEPLIDIVERGHIVPGRTALWLHQVAGALHCVHQEGIVHRDVKPHNILICASGAKLADFGIAKDEEATTHVTKVGHLIGTIAYMPPEQTGLGGATVDPRTDVYALGATLYHCLVGKTPFSGSREVLIRAVLEALPTPPRALDPEIPRDLEAIALKCLEKEPEERYQSALEMQEDLGRYLAGEPVLARNPSWFELGWAWVKRHRKAVLACIVVALAVAGAFGAFIGAGVLRDRAAAKAALERGEELFAKGKYDEAEAQFAEAARLKTPYAQQGSEGVLRARAWNCIDEVERSVRELERENTVEKRAYETLEATATLAHDARAYQLVPEKRVRAQALADISATPFTRDRIDARIQAAIQRALEIFPTRVVGQKCAELLYRVYEGQVSLGASLPDPERLAQQIDSIAVTYHFASPINPATVTVNSNPAAALLTIYELRYDPHTGVERALPFRSKLGVDAPQLAPKTIVGQTPLRSLPIPAGSYLIVCSLDGYLDAREPILVNKGDKLELDVQMIRSGIVNSPSRFHHITHGLARGGLGFRVARLDSDILLQEREVTFSDWEQFWISTGRRPDLLPAGVSAESIGVMQSESAWPVRRVSYEQAKQYCRWFESRYVTDVSWEATLPRVREFYRAIRGPLRRTFAWGELYDFSFCGVDRTEIAHGTADWKEDESIFGVRDLSGSVAELTDDVIEPGFVVFVGGTFVDTEAQARARLRGDVVQTIATNMAAHGLGFRVAIRHVVAH